MTITKAASRRVRLKVLGSIAGTHGYAILGLAIVQPMLSAAPKFTPQQIGGLIVGLAMEVFAVYIASIRRAVMTPLEIALYFVSPPLVLACAYSVWLTWREKPRD